MLDQELAGELCRRAGPVCRGFVIMPHCTIGFSHLHTIGLVVSLILETLCQAINEFLNTAAWCTGTRNYHLEKSRRLSCLVLAMCLPCIGLAVAL